MWLGVDDFVDENSLWYHGGEAIGIAHSMAIPASKAGPWIGRRPNGKLYDPKWKNRRKVLLNRGIADPGVDMHHWLFKQSHPIARRYPHFFNQPWNLVKAPKEQHRLLHRKNIDPWDVFKHGIPNWAKAEALLLGGHSGRYAYRFLFD